MAFVTRKPYGPVTMRPHSKERIVKKSEKHGLYNAMDIGTIWLERALK